MPGRLCRIDSLDGEAVGKERLEKMAKKKDFHKLAQLIKLAAKDVAREDAWWKVEDVSIMLGFEKNG